MTALKNSNYKAVEYVECVAGDINHKVSGCPMLKSLNKKNVLLTMSIVAMYFYFSEEPWNNNSKKTCIISKN